MTTVSLTGKQFKQVITGTVDFEIEPSLLKEANSELAKAIIASVADNDMSFCTNELFSTYRIELTDLEPESCSKLFQLMLAADIESESSIDGTIKSHEQEKGTSLTENEVAEISKKVFLSNRNEAMCEFLNGLSWVSSNYENAESFYHEATYESENNLVDAILESIDNLHEGIEVSSDIFTEDFESLLRQAMVNLMMERDTSTYLDLIPYDKVELNFVKGLDWQNAGIEDAHSVVQETIDSNILPMFEMGNLDPKLVFELAKKKNLEDGAGYDLEYLEPLTTLEFTLNESLPTYLSPESALLIIEEQYMYSIPMYTTYVEFRELLSTDFKNGVWLSKGMIGLEDCINGAGYNEDIDTSKSQFFISKEEMYKNVTLFCNKGFSHVYFRNSVYDFYLPNVKSHIKEA